MDIVKYLVLLISCFIISKNTYSQGDVSWISDNDFKFLESLTKDVLESSRIYPGGTVPLGHGLNNTGGVVVRPGGRDCYPAFWIRDYAMSLDCGFVPAKEQEHMLLLAASTQCGQTWIADEGGMIPQGSVADHIRMDNSLPIYFPGTYNYEKQGIPSWGMVPPYGDQFLFIHMAYYYLQSTSDTSILTTKINGTPLIDRLELAYNVPPTRNGSPVVYTTDAFRGVDFGFRDAIIITGDLCYPTILKYRASIEMAKLYEMLGYEGKAKKYINIALGIKDAIPKIFMDEDGMLRASTGRSSQPDVWGTALAVYYDIIDGSGRMKTCSYLAGSYLNGTLAFRGNVRHVLTSNDSNASTAWEATRPGLKKNTYQNGAYWGTPVGWVCFAIAQANPQLAKKMFKEYVDELRENDYRKGEGFGAPYECFNRDGEKQNPVYLTSVTCPYAVVKQKIKKD